MSAPHSAPSLDTPFKGQDCIYALLRYTHNTVHPYNTSLRYYMDSCVYTSAGTHSATIILSPSALLQTGVQLKGGIYTK